MTPSHTLLLIALASLGWSDPVPTTPPTAPPAPRCPSGNPNPAYTVKAGDTCASISRDKEVSTLNLIAVNGLNAECSNLSVGRTICIPPVCKVYEVQTGDTCESIAGSNNLTLPQFFGYNPGIINPDCTNVNISTNVCLEASRGSNFPFPIFTTTTSIPTSAASAPASSAIAVQPGPEQIIPGTNLSCTMYGTAVSGDTCSTIARRNRLKTSAFRNLNPRVDARCNNLKGSERYCVQAVNLTNATTTNATPHCGALQRFIKADTCDTIAFQNDISLDTFLALNPNVDANCTNLVPGGVYCVKAPTAANSTNATATCGNTQRPVPGDTCEIFTAQNGISLDTFRALNPGLNTNCTNFVTGQVYCVKALTPRIPCGATQRPVPGDTCEIFTARNGISVATFLALNPDLYRDCRNLEPGESYCVKPPAARTGTPTSSSPSGRHSTARPTTTPEGP
ncbi:MAG: hypothetical protein Q9163_002997 [Psora crenata]